MTEQAFPDLQEVGDLEFLARVASLYYEEGYTQQQISEQLGYSRSAVSRFLTSAREAGIVEIRIHHPLMRVSKLETALRDLFKLQIVQVLDRRGLDESRMLSRLGGLGAQVASRALKDGMIIGVSWGTAVFEVANALRPAYLPNATVIQLVGALGTRDPEIDGVELTRFYARTLGARYRLLPAPAIVESPAVRDSLMRDRPVRDVLDCVSEVAFAVVGIGATDPERSSLVRAEYLTQTEVYAIASAGAVGDVCAIHYDADGTLLDLPLTARTVGIQAAQLRQIPLVLGVAGGEAKATAILGAIRAQLINAIVTDDVAARLVLEAAEHDSST